MGVLEVQKGLGGMANPSADGVVSPHRPTYRSMTSQVADVLILKKVNIENEGESHDVVENKGSNFLSHDVDDAQ